MKFKNRPYQSKCVESVRTAFETHQSVLAVMPTASGKSVVFSDLIHGIQPGRSLILANRGELLFQAARHVERTGLTTSIEKADLAASTSPYDRTQVVIASVQTMISMDGIARRMHKWNPKDFSLIVCDEAHLFIAPSFRAILNYFKNGNPDIKIFGCTATPKRADSKAMGLVFEHCAYEYTIGEAINDGWLVPVSPLCLRVEGLDFSSIRPSSGDLNREDLAKVMEAEKPLYGIAQGTLEAVFSVEPNTLKDIPVEKWREFLMDGQTPPKTALVFTVSVKHSEMLSEIFNRVVPNLSNWISGKTREDDRAIINARFKSGLLPILVNCGTHTTGVDIPRAEIIVPKPTKSVTLALQMYGRGFRPPEVAGRSIVDQYETAEERKFAISRSRKPKCIILDFHGVTGKHKLINPFDILGGDYSKATSELAVKKAIERGTPVNITEEMDKAQKELDLKIAESKLKNSNRKSNVIARASFAVSTTDMFNSAASSAMRMIPKAKKVVSEGMAKILRGAGHRDPYSLPYEEALRLVRKRFEQFNKWKKKK